MRNLKRVLSLTLASIMLLGMMVIGTSAASDYPDVDYDNDNVEAIEVLEAINVMTGYPEDGTFKPGNEVSRAEMARIMAALMDLDYDYYIGVNPFTDMAGHWAEGYAAACAANGIIAGRTATTYDPSATVTAVEAAAMLMRALGYFQNWAADYADGFEISTIRQAGRINLFDQVDVKTNEPMTRNDVAQLILNTLQSGMVEPSENSKVEVTVGDAQVTIGSSNYVYVVSRDRNVGNAINTDQALQGNGADGLTGPILDLGEKLYNGELKLSGERNNNFQNISDVFGRPARQWEYKGELIGTYAKKELLVESYTAAVTGRTVYDLLGQSVIRDYGLDVYLDGADNSDNLTRARLARTDERDLPGTGRGVLTEIYLDTENTQITIVSINTYLAQANSDYNESSETISLTVYNSNGGITKLVDVEDVPGIVDLLKDDWILVDWADASTADADKVVQNMYETEIMENVVVTGFASSTEDSSDYDDPDDPTRKVTDITVDGNTYKNNIKAFYKANTLNNYSTDRLVDKTYTLYMDRYGYFIGAELYSGKAQYVFITGYDRPASAISTSTAKANGIFADGTMAVIDVNVLDTNKNIVNANADAATTYNGDYNTWTDDEPHDEMWYSYTVRNNVYTLTPAAGWTRTFAPAADTVIDCSNVRLVPTPAASSQAYGTATYTMNGTGNSYGEDASVYITVDPAMDDVDRDATDRGGRNRKGIAEVEGVYTGVQNVKLLYQPGNWVNAVYDPDNSYIIAAVVLGEAEGVVDNYAYIRGGAKNERIETDSNGDVIHYWDVEVIMDGELTTKTIKSRYTNTTGKLVPDTVQELIMDSDGYVTTIRSLPNSLNNAETTEVADTSPLAKVQNNDKVYTNFDYLYNGTGAQGTVTPVNGGKPDATDLANYSVYHIKVDETFYGTRGIGLTSITRKGTTYTFGGNRVTDLTLKGNTLHYDPDQGDVGLTVMENAKGFIYHVVNNKWKYEDAGSVSTAFNMINDADYNGTNNLTDGKQFRGEIVAVLNSTGRAEWVLFIDLTPPQSGATPAPTPTYPGETYSDSLTLARVQQLLNDGEDVIIDGNWQPADLATISSRVLTIPRGRTLTILGDLDCRQDGTNNITIIAESSETSTLNVTGKLTLYRQSVNFPIYAGDVDYRTGGGTWNISGTMEVEDDFTMYGNGTVNITSSGTLTVDGTISTNSGDVAELTVNGKAYTGDVENTTITVLSTNSLHVNGTVQNGATIIVGGGTGNGYAEINELDGTLTVNNANSSTKASEVATTGRVATLDIMRGTLLIREEISTNQIKIAASQKLTFGANATATGNAATVFVDSNNIPIRNIGGSTVTAPAGGYDLVTNPTDKIKVEGAASIIDSTGKIDSSATADEIEAALEAAKEDTGTGGLNGALSIDNLAVDDSTGLTIPDGTTLTVKNSASGKITTASGGVDTDGGGALVLDGASVPSGGSLELEGDSISGTVSVGNGAALEIGKINDGYDASDDDPLVVNVSGSAKVEIDQQAEGVVVSVSQPQSKPVTIKKGEGEEADNTSGMATTLQAMFPDGGMVDVGDVVKTSARYNTEWGMVTLVIPKDVSKVIVEIYDSKGLVAVTGDTVNGEDNPGAISLTSDYWNRGAFEWARDTIYTEEGKYVPATADAGVTYTYKVYSGTITLNDEYTEVDEGGHTCYKTVTRTPASTTPILEGSFTAVGPQDLD